MKQEKTIERNFFNKVAEDSIEYQRFSEDSYKKIFSLLEKSVVPKAGETILDVGCGTGAFTYRLKQAFPASEIRGVDISEKCIEVAKMKYKNVSFFSADAEAIPLESESVDIITFFGVLHHFPDFQNVAKESFRILKPGGRIFSLDPHHHNPVFWLFRSHESPLYCSVGVTSQERLLTSKEFKRVFSANQFLVGTKIISGIKFATVEAGFMKRLMPLYNFFDQILSVTPLAPLIGAWLIGNAKKASV